MKLQFLLIVGLFDFVFSLQNSSQIENDCRNCTSPDTGRGFYKIIWSTFASPTYICAVKPWLAGAFGLIVEKSCSPDTCLNISTRGLTKTFSVTDGGCENQTSITYTVCPDCTIEHPIEPQEFYNFTEPSGQAIRLIKNTLETAFMSIILIIMFYWRRHLLPGNRMNSLV